MPLKTLPKRLLRKKTAAVYGLPEEEKGEQQLICISKISDLLQDIGEKPRIQACRIGAVSKNAGKIRPVKVTLTSAVSVGQIQVNIGSY